MDYAVDAIVIGAGVVGLAVARELAGAGHETIVLERASAIGTEASSRNSEVVHAGIYYPEASLKATLCVRGKQLLYAYAESHKIDFRRCGKLVLAAGESDRAKLQAISQRALGAGVDDLRLLSAQEIRELEPEADAVAGLLSPSTGIIDSHQLMLALQGDLESSGGTVAFNTPVERGSLTDGGLHVLHVTGDNAASIGCQILVNAAGLGATAIWDSLQKPPGSYAQPKQHFAIGHYYSYAGKPPFSRPVYPVPEEGGLGIHATPDLAGQIRFGPDVRWIEAVDYAFDDSARSRFAESIRRYFPGLDATRLQPAYTGIRSKLAGAGVEQDFMIYTPEDSGLTGYVGLHGIESPGLTAALAIAERVERALR